MQAAAAAATAAATAQLARVCCRRAAGGARRGSGADVLLVVGLELGDKNDITVKGLEAVLGPFEAFDSAVGLGAQRTLRRKRRFA